MFQLQQQYNFFYLDTLEVVRALPEIAEKRRQLLGFQQQQIKFMMEFNTFRGSFIKPMYQNQFEELTGIFCMTMDTWIGFQYINGKKDPDENNYCNDLWAILRILFTDMGLPEFRQLQQRTIN